MRVFLTCLILIPAQVLVFVSCSGGGPVVRVPQTAHPAADVPRLDTAPDPNMRRAIHVIKEYGRKAQGSMEYGEYQRLRKHPDSALSAEIFYDRHVLDMNEDDYWVTLTLNTATAARSRDPRIGELMGAFPENALDVRLKTPAGIVYLLSDSEADGVLDFATREGGDSNPHTVDLELLKKMQRRYAWVLGIVKRHYK